MKDIKNCLFVLTLCLISLFVFSSCGNQEEEENLLAPSREKANPTAVASPPPSENLATPANEPNEEEHHGTLGENLFSRVIAVEDIIAAGNACPDDSVKFELDEQNLKIRFSKFKSEFRIGADRQTCTIALPIKIEAGKTLKTKMEIQGTSALQASTDAVLAYKFFANVTDADSAEFERIPLSTETAKFKAESREISISNDSILRINLNTSALSKEDLEQNIKVKTLTLELQYQ